MSDDHKKGPKRPPNPIDDLFRLTNLGAQVLVGAGEVIATSTRIAANVIDEIEREVTGQPPAHEPPHRAPSPSRSGGAKKKRRPHHTAPPPTPTPDHQDQRQDQHHAAPTPQAAPRPATRAPEPSGDAHPALRRFLSRRTTIALEDRHPYTEKAQHLALRPDGTAQLTITTPDRQDDHTGAWHTSPTTRADALWLDVETGPLVFRFRLSVDPDAPHHVYLDEEQARFGLAGKFTRRFDVE